MTLVLRALNAGIAKNLKTIEYNPTKKTVNQMYWLAKVNLSSWGIIDDWSYYEKPKKNPDQNPPISGFIDQTPL
jgi:hypothetical protein